MKNIFEAPKMNISTFDVENIVTESSKTAEAVVTSEIEKAAAANGVTLAGQPIVLTF